MTTTGTANFNETAQQIVDISLRTCGQLGEDETSAGTAQYTNTALALNGLVKQWQAMGLHVWTEEEAILFLQAGQAQYALGGTTLDNCCDVANYVQTTTAAAQAQGASTVTLATTLGFAVGQYVGVLLASNVMFWSAISGIAGAVITLAAALPGPVNSGVIVVAYTTKILRPLKVPNARLLNLVSNQLTPLTVLSRQEYMDLPNPLSKGLPNQFFYSPKLVSGQLYVWGVQQQATYALRFTWYRPIFDINSPTDTMDFPQEWMLPLSWALAEEIAPQYDVPPPRWQMITAKAQAAREMAEGWDRESEPIRFGMEWQFDT